MINLVALGFHLWSAAVAGLPGVMAELSRQDRQAHVEPGPHISLL